MASPGKTMQLLLAFVCVSLSAEGYTVQTGDTLYSIARRHGVHVNEIVAANPGIAVDALRIGQQLVLPDAVSAENNRATLLQYSVQKGDTLYSIARRFQTTPSILQAINNLNGAAIQTGMLLKVPEGDQGGAVAVGSSVQPLIANTESVSSNALHWPAQGTLQKVSGKFPGVAIATKNGSKGVAVASGRVTYAGAHSVFANVVFIQHKNGYVYVYAGLSDLTVSIGDAVEQGSALGTVVKTVQSAVPQLYFSVWKNDRYVDPQYAPRE